MAEESLDLTAPLISPAPPGASFGEPRPELRRRRHSQRSLARRLNRVFDRATKQAIVISAAVAVGLGATAAIFNVPIWATLGVCLLVAAIGSVWLPLVLIQPSDRHLQFVLGVGETEVYEAWRANFPADPLLRNELAAVAWLKKRSPAERRFEALTLESAALMGLGRYEEARERLERVEPMSPFDRFERALMRAGIDYESGREGDLSAARELLEDVGAPKERVARAEFALEEATRELIAGRPWAPPIDEAHRRIGWPTLRILIAVGLLVRARYYRTSIALGGLAVGLAVGALYRLL